MISCHRDGGADDGFPGGLMIQLFPVEKGTQMRETHNKKTLRLSRVIAGAVTALLTAAAAAVGTVIYGLIDYLYDPEFFRPGKKPRPSPDPAPGEAEVDRPLLRVG